MNRFENWTYRDLSRDWNVHIPPANYTATIEELSRLDSFIFSNDMRMIAKFWGCYEIGNLLKCLLHANVSDQFKAEFIAYITYFGALADKTYKKQIYLPTDVISIIIENAQISEGFDYAWESVCNTIKSIISVPNYMFKNATDEQKVYILMRWGISI